MKIRMIRDDGVSGQNLTLRSGQVYDLEERIATRLVRVGSAIPASGTDMDDKVSVNVPDTERVVLLKWRVGI